MRRMRALSLGLLATLLCVFAPLHWHRVSTWDGLSICLAGWPLPWLSPSLATSLSSRVHLQHLAVDLAFWTLISRALLTRLRAPTLPVVIATLVLLLRYAPHDVEWLPCDRETSDAHIELGIYTGLLCEHPE
jgi:hypothetical protein